jgi:hypothetical protein
VLEKITKKYTEGNNFFKKIFFQFSIEIMDKKRYNPNLKIKKGCA